MVIGDIIMIWSLLPFEIRIGPMNGSGLFGFDPHNSSTVHSV